MLKQKKLKTAEVCKVSVGGIKHRFPCYQRVWGFWRLHESHEVDHWGHHVFVRFGSAKLFPTTVETPRCAPEQSLALPHKKPTTFFFQGCLKCPINFLASSRRTRMWSRLRPICHPIIPDVFHAPWNSHEIAPYQKNKEKSTSPACWKISKDQPPTIGLLLHNRTKCHMTGYGSQRTAARAFRLMDFLRFHEHWRGGLQEAHSGFVWTIYIHLLWKYVFEWDDIN